MTARDRLDDPAPFTDSLTVALAGRAAGVAAGLLAAHEENLGRRARVLRHPDLAQRLTRTPLGFARPEQWTGFVPPRLCQYQEPELLHSPGGHPNERRRRTDPQEINNSPRRAALVEICAEALRREGMAGE